MLVGLTGRNASAKSTFVEWFSPKGLRTVRKQELLEHERTGADLNIR